MENKITYGVRYRLKMYGHNMQRKDSFWSIDQWVPYETLEDAQKAAKKNQEILMLALNEYEDADESRVDDSWENSLFINMDGIIFSADSVRCADIRVCSSNSWIISVAGNKGSLTPEELLDLGVSLPRVEGV